MKLNVKYYSQRKDVADPEWKAHSCLIVCVKMISEFLGEKIIPADDWIKEGTLVGAWDGKFWKHNEIIRLFRNHGISGYAQEFKTVDVNVKSGEMKVGDKSEIFLNRGIEKISEKLDSGCPMIISIRKFFTDDNTHHGVVVIGYEKDENNIIKGFYYHDPEIDGDRGGENLFVELDKFKNGWKRLAIFSDK